MPPSQIHLDLFSENEQIDKIIDRIILDNNMDVRAFFYHLYLPL